MTSEDTLVFDVFCYNGEPIVELRLAMLAPVVDHFYIVESSETFSGLTKPALYKDIHANLFAPYESKITWIILDKDAFQHSQGNAWRREEASRNAPLQRILSDMKSVEKRRPYILLVCDVDEIPRPELVLKLHQKENYELMHKPIALQMEFFYYNFHWIKAFPWMHPFVINEDGLLNSKATFDTIRLSPKASHIPNAGWHCSYFETIENIVRKIESFSHQEHNTEGLKSPAHIGMCMKNGIDLFARGCKEDLVEYDVSKLPTILLQFNEQIKLLQ